MEISEFCRSRKIRYDVRLSNVVCQPHLTNQEKALLYTCGLEYFSPDAWLAAGHNMQDSMCVNDLVLPTESEEKFCLFLVNKKPSKISNVVFSTKIKGRWLHLDTNGEYTVIDHVDTIVGKNIVRTALFFLLFFKFFPPIRVKVRVRVKIKLLLVG